MSLLNKLQNTIMFKVNNLVSDPAADTYAAEQKQKEEQEKANAEAAKKTQDATAKAAEEKRQAELNKAPSDMQTTTNVATKVFIGIVGVIASLALGSMLANASIHRDVTIRILNFLYGSVLGAMITILALNNFLFFGLFSVIVGFLYLTGNIPHMFTFLPITHMKPESSIGALFLLPFRWDTNKHEEHYNRNLDAYKAFKEAGKAVRVVKEPSKPDA